MHETCGDSYKSSCARATLFSSLCPFLFVYMHVYTKKDCPRREDWWSVYIFTIIYIYARRANVCAPMVFVVEDYRNRVSDSRKFFRWRFFSLFFWSGVLMQRGLSLGWRSSFEATFQANQNDDWKLKNKFRII